MDDGGGVRAGCIRIRYRSPRKIMARWFSSQGKVKGKKKTAMAEGRVRDFNAVGISKFSEDSHGVPKISDSPPQAIDSEPQRKEFLFSIGVTCYLLHLIATGREEIHKIIELRNDLEKLLECKNDELKRKQQEFVKLRSDIEGFLECHNDQMGIKQKKFLFGKQEQSDTSPYSTTSDVVVDGPESSNDHYYSRSPQFLETSLSVGREGSLKHYLLKGGEEMDQLEAELEAEFELLQISQDHERKCCKLKDISEKSEDVEQLRFRQMCPGAVEEEQGVCPYELERRLHELLEIRQEEEIKELEFALEDAKLRLRSKEAEASWWKDTAYIVSEHIPERSRITPNSQSHRYPLSR